MNKTELDTRELEDLLNPPNRSVIRTDQFGIDGLTTPEWLKKIEDALAHQDGVQSAHVDPEKHVVIVSYDARRTNVPELHDAILKSGYKPARTAS